MKQVLALLADWANGLFAVLLVSYWFGVDPQWWYFLVGILMSHSPDIDAIPEIIRRGRVSASAVYPHDHRAVLHFPIILITLAAIIAHLTGYWGWMFLVAKTLHLLNDLYGTGWGIKLAWPITHKNYKF